MPNARKNVGKLRSVLSSDDGNERNVMVIYKITNVKNGKVYVGKSKFPAETRFRRHLQDAKSGRLDTHLAKAIRRYGEECFELETIDETEDEEELNEKERFWIRKFDSIRNGYNMTEGADGGNTYRFKSDSDLDVVKEKIRNSKLGSRNPNSKSVKCKSVLSGKELTFGSLEECRAYFNERNNGFLVRRCSRRTNYLYRGEWLFAYENEEFPNEYQFEKNNRKSKAITVRDLISNESETFQSYASAERFYGLKPKTFSSKAFRHKTKTFVVLKRYEITVIG